MASIGNASKLGARSLETGCSGEYSPLDHRPESGSSRRISGHGGRSGCPIALGRAGNSGARLFGRQRDGRPPRGIPAREPQASDAFLGMSHARSQTWFHRNEMVTEAVSALWKRARHLRPHGRRDRLSKSQSLSIATFRSQLAVYFPKICVTGRGVVAVSAGKMG